MTESLNRHLTWSSFWWSKIHRASIQESLLLDALPLHLAAKSSATDIVEFLVAADLFTVLKRNSDGRTPLECRPIAIECYL